MAEHIMDAFRLKGIDSQHPNDIYTLPRTNVDSTLSQEGDAADAKVVGDEFTGLKEDLSNLGLSVVDGAINITYEEVSA